MTDKMSKGYESEEEWFLDLLNRLRKLTFAQHPLQDTEVTMPQLTLLDWVAATPGCSVRDIANGLGLSAPTVSVSVRRLEASGLMTRRPDPTDRRAVRLFLTPQGQALQQRAWAFRQGKAHRLLAGLSSDERITLLTLLERAITTAEATKTAPREDEYE